MGARVLLRIVWSGFGAGRSLGGELPYPPRCGHKKVCLSKVGLKFPAPSINFIFGRRTISLMWGGGSVGWGCSGPHIPPPPPRWGFGLATPSPSPTSHTSVSQHPWPCVTLTVLVVVSTPQPGVFVMTACRALIRPSGEDAMGRSCILDPPPPPSGRFKGRVQGKGSEWRSASRRRQLQTRSSHHGVMPKPPGRGMPTAVRMPAAMRMPACHSRRFKGKRSIGAATG